MYTYFFKYNHGCGHPLAFAHCNTSKCPFLAAQLQVFSSHGHPLALAHCNTSKYPFLAAQAQVNLFHGHPLARANCNRDVDSTALLIIVVVVLSFS